MPVNYHVSVRDIPIQRSASAFAPMSSLLTGTNHPLPGGRALPLRGTSVYSSTRHYPLAGTSTTAGPHEEYYKREVGLIINEIFENNLKLFFKKSFILL